MLTSATTTKELSSVTTQSVLFQCILVKPFHLSGHIFGFCLTNQDLEVSTFSKIQLLSLFLVCVFLLPRYALSAATAYMYYRLRKNPHNAFR